VIFSLELGYYLHLEELYMILKLLAPTDRHFHSGKPMTDFLRETFAIFQQPRNSGKHTSSTNKNNYSRKQARARAGFPQALAIGKWVGEDESTP
jgi:hypothetical protein